MSDVTLVVVVVVVVAAAVLLLLLATNLSLTASSSEFVFKNDLLVY